MAFPKMGEITDKFVGQPYDLNSVLSPAKVWEKLDAQSEEVRVFVNSLIDLLNSTGEDNWLYTAIASALLGQLTDGSLTDAKLSDDAGQIKERLTSFVATYDAFVATYDAFVATKGQTGGLASLDSGGNLVQKPYVTGTYTGDGGASRSISLGFKPSAVFIANRFGSATQASSDFPSGLATDGYPASYTYSGTEYKSVEVTTDGFNVFDIPNAGGGTVDIATNSASTTYNPYRYIAFR